MYGHMTSEAGRMERDQTWTLVLNCTINWRKHAFKCNAVVMHRTAECCPTGPARDGLFVWNPAAKSGIPLSATEMVLLKYCSSTFQDVSFTLFVTPQKPQQFILIAAN